MDGNNSLKRILRRVLGEDDVPGPSSERTDSRTVDDDFYLTREYVDQWANEAFEDLMATENQVHFKPFSLIHIAHRYSRMTMTTIHALTDGKT